MDTAPRAPVADGLALAAASLLLYLVLAQEAFHGLDVHVHVYFLTQGHLEHPFHFLYLKLAGAAWAPLRALGLSPHQALRLLSALGTAAAVFFAHRAAARLGSTRRSALLVATLTAVLPAVVFFATVAEIHGVFAAFAGVAWWTWASFARRPSLGRALAVGMATGIAATVHATGHLLPLLFVPLALAWPHRVRTAGEPDGPHPSWWTLAASLAAHGLVAIAFAVVLQPARLRVPFEGQLGFLRDYAANHDWPLLDGALRVVLDEWLIALFPLSLTGIVAIACRRSRGPAVMLLPGTLVYLAVTLALLDDTNERGAYLLPFAFPLALITARAFSPRWLVAFALAGGCAAWLQVHAHDRVAAVAWLDGFLAVADERPVAVICRDVAEQEAITRARPDVPFVRVDSLLAGAEREEGYDAFCGAFDALVERYCREGRSVLVTRPAYEAMLASGKPLLRRFLLEHLPRKHAVEEITRAGFAALRVRC